MTLISYLEWNLGLYKRYLGSTRDHEDKIALRAKIEELELIRDMINQTDDVLDIIDSLK